MRRNKVKPNSRRGLHLILFSLNTIRMEDSGACMLADLQLEMCGQQLKINRHMPPPQGPFPPPRRVEASYLDRRHERGVGGWPGACVSMASHTALGHTAHRRTRLHVGNAKTICMFLPHIAHADKRDTIAAWGPHLEGFVLGHTPLLDAIRELPYTILRLTHHTMKSWVLAIADATPSPIAQNAPGRKDTFTRIPWRGPSCIVWPADMAIEVKMCAMEMVFWRGGGGISRGKIADFSLLQPAELD